MKHILLLVLISNLSFSQKNIQLSVVDLSNDLAIPFVPITDISNNFVGYSDENGQFMLSELSGSEKFKVCFLSYVCRTFTVQDLETSNGKIYLTQKPIELATVTVNPSQKNTRTIGYHKSKTTFKWGSGSGLIFANYFINRHPETPYLSKVFVGMNNSLKEKKNTLIRLRLYKPNSDNSPGEDLTTLNLHYVVKRIQKDLELNVDSLNIKIPQEGIVVGIEIIGFYKGKDLVSSQRGVYTIGICSTEDKNRQTIGSAWRYSIFDNGWFSANYGNSKDVMFKIGIEVTD